MAQLATLHIYVVGVDSLPNMTPDDCDAAWGIFYDSVRMWNHNNSGKFQHVDPLCAGRQAALFEGVLEALRDAPQGHNIVIESETKWFVHQINRAFHRRNTEQDPKRKRECDHETPILDLIDFRTKKGDCYVEIRYTEKDPTAKRGFSQARALARKALAASQNDDDD